MSNTPIPDTRSWPERLKAAPAKPRGFYLRQALLIALALIAAFGMIYMTFERDSWNLWLTGAYLLVVLSCRRMAVRMFQSAAFPVPFGDPDGGLGSLSLLFFLFFVLAVIAIPLLASVLLIWNVIQAVRASDAGPAEDDRRF